MPEAGKPEDFGGAVGDFEFSVTTSKTQLNASESLQAREVSGKGNLKLFQLPELELPSALEVYEPEFDEKVRTNLSGMQGSVANNYTVVPSFRGKYPIPSISFSYFNPKTKTYQTITSDEISIAVLEGPEDQNAPSQAANMTNKIAITKNKQFGFIKTESAFSPKKKAFFYGSQSFYLWFFIPLALIPLVILFRKKKEKDQRNVASINLRKQIN